MILTVMRSTLKQGRRAMKRRRTEKRDKKLIKELAAYQLNFEEMKQCRGGAASFTYTPTSSARAWTSAPPSQS